MEEQKNTDKYSKLEQMIENGGEEERLRARNIMENERMGRRKRNGTKIAEIGLMIGCYILQILCFAVVLFYLFGNSIFKDKIGVATAVVYLAIAAMLEAMKYKISYLYRLRKLEEENEEE